MNDLLKIINYSRAMKSQWIDYACELIRIPGISTLPEYSADVIKTAEWLAGELSQLGFNVEIITTRKHPIVFARLLSNHPDARTVLVYGHYDVQPVDPLAEWETPPFEPKLEGDFLYARGAMDMKGQIAAFLCALKSIQQFGEIPLALKCVFEGEEEIGSPDLAEFLEQNKARLSCNTVLNLDGLILKPDIPSIVYGLRGMAYFDLEVKGLDHDLHSGIYGGTFHNPVQALCELIAGMHDEEGRITLPEFYQSVIPLSPDERAELGRVPFKEMEYLQEAGANALWGEVGYSTIERRGARPTMEVNGVIGGFTGMGAKTIIPARANAKISFRLVPIQTPEQVHTSLHAYIEKNLPPGMQFNLNLLSAASPACLQRDNWAVKVAETSLEKTFGKSPVFVREGGTVPVISMLKEILGYESVVLGCGLPEDNMHAPNERLRVSLFMKCIEVYLRYIFGLAEAAGNRD